MEIEPALVTVYVYLVRTASLERCEIVDGASAGDESALILGRRGSGYGGTSDGTTGQSSLPIDAIDTSRD